MFNNHVSPKLFFFLLFSFLAPSAYAYQFGPPPITELAEAGKTQNRFSVYSQKTVYPDSAVDPTLLGISVASSTGDKTGGSTGMFRLAKYSDKRSVYSGYTDSTGVLIGGGFGGQWYLGESRNFGLLLDGQMDFLAFNYDLLLTNGRWTTMKNTQLAFGLEAGALYRIFIDTATITPFVTAMTGRRSRNGSSSLACSNCDYKYNYVDSGTTIGIDFMMGKFAASVLRTNASYVATGGILASPAQTSPAQNSTITMLMLGMNF